MAHTLEDYLFLVLRPSILSFSENIGCDAFVGL